MVFGELSWYHPNPTRANRCFDISQVDAYVVAFRLCMVQMHMPLGTKFECDRKEWRLPCDLIFLWVRYLVGFFMLTVPIFRIVNICHGLINWMSSRCQKLRFHFSSSFQIVWLLQYICPWKNVNFSCL